VDNQLDRRHVEGVRLCCLLRCPERRLAPKPLCATERRHEGTDQRRPIGLAPRPIWRSASSELAHNNGRKGQSCAHPPVFVGTPGEVAARIMGRSVDYRSSKPQNRLRDLEAGR
jgi:hypothetical protein